MANVQVVEGSLLQPAGPGAAPRNLGQELAAGAGTVALGRQVSQAGAVMENFAQKLQAVTNEADLSAAHLMMKKGSAAYEEEMTRNQDETTWQEGWESRSEQVASEILSKDLPPDVMDRLEIDIQAWQEQGSQKVRAASTKRTIGRQKVKFANAAEYAYEQGDTEGGDAEIDKMGLHGLVNDDEINALKTKGLQTAQKAQINAGILDDPWQMTEDLKEETEGGKPKNFKSIKGQDRLTLLRKAETRLNRVRTQTNDSIIQGRMNGETYEQEDLQLLVDQHLLKATQMKWIMDEQSRKGLVPEINHAAVNTWKRIQDYDFDADEVDEQLPQIMGEIHRQPAAMKDLLLRQLKNKINASQPTAQSGSAGNKDFLEVFDKMLDRGAFGNASTSTVTGKFLNPEEGAEAENTYLELKVGFQAWTEKEPRSQAEKLAYVQSIQQTFRRDPTKVLDSLTGGRRRR